MPSALDDRTVAYVIAARPVFEDLRQIAAQLSALLVLAATGSKESTPDHPMLVSASRLFEKTTDSLRQLTPPARARLHHQHLRASESALRAALDAARIWPMHIDAVLDPLRKAYSDLQEVSRSLPGFQLVAFEQGCCAVHLKVDTTYATHNRT
jgi:hypothetical protein